MRILYSHRVQSRDGQAVRIEETVAALQDAGCEVRVVGPPSYDQAAFGGSNRHTDMLRRILPPSIGVLAEITYNIPARWRLLRPRRFTAYAPGLHGNRESAAWTKGEAPEFTTATLTEPCKIY